MRKLYCYVDESGQDTGGRFFVVGVVVFADERTAIQERLIKLETTSGKRQRKWQKANSWSRSAYIMGLITAPIATLALYFKTFANTSDYLQCTVEAVTQSLRDRDPLLYKAIVVLDGADQVTQRKLGARLRERRVSLEKVRGFADETDPLIRLADAVAGFSRDDIEGHKHVQGLFKEACKSGLLRELT